MDQIRYLKTLIAPHRSGQELEHDLPSCAFQERSIVPQSHVAGYSASRIDIRNVDPFLVARSFLR